MIYELKKEFIDFAHPLGKGRFYVNADKDISPFNRELYPIYFSGFINGQKIEFVLKNQNSEYLDNYDFLIYPKAYEYLKKEIPQWIDEYLNDSMK